MTELADSLIIDVLGFSLSQMSHILELGDLVIGHLHLSRSTSLQLAAMVLKRSSLIVPITIISVHSLGTLASVVEAVIVGRVAAVIVGRVAAVIVGRVTAVIVGRVAAVIVGRVAAVIVGRVSAHHCLTQTKEESCACKVNILQ